MNCAIMRSVDELEMGNTLRVTLTQSSSALSSSGEDNKQDTLGQDDLKNARPEVFEDEDEMHNDS